MKKLIILAAVVFGFAATSFAQRATASYTASVELKKALHMEKVADLNFGTIFFPADGGIVTLAGTQAATISGAGFTEGTGNVKTAAKFNYGAGLGAQGHSYSVSAWTAPITLKSAANNSLSLMPVWGTFGMIGGDINERFQYLGGELTVPAGTLPGVYTSEAMTVSVDNN